MSNSQPELKSEEKQTRSNRPKLKDKLKEMIPQGKAKSDETEAAAEKVTRKQQKAKQKAEKRKKKKPRRRVFPIWLRIIVVLLLCAIALVVGAVVGYGVVGSGKPSDALDMDTWRHIIDIVTKTKK
ncbi:hypothetical protein CFK37_07965 [Virgibacillus phasianinus]|uniref:DNA-directed RNA polymerase subunit beta n=1 Tax=Virgibacillus phasianinus TaxID=2017483 RepID=A0A220U2N1_9BACI|nr:DNA-directed RNA polymerase subunit beta [Virgibacillus phasianinus]ASK62101.1 hypothetical protein CFK37_07965 [Virgibacillus phasianinus]